MGRPLGTKNPGHNERRLALAHAVLPRLLAEGGAQASLSELAAAAGVSVPTLKHYFPADDADGEAARDGAGDASAPPGVSPRSAVVRAALLSVADLSRDVVDTGAVPTAADLGASLSDFARALLLGWREFGVDRYFAGGMAVALDDDAAGPAYLGGVLEPTLGALEARLCLHAARGQADLDPADPADVRAAALAFLSPLLVALLHQSALGGVACRPLDVDDFTARHVRRFVLAYGPRAALGDRAG